MEQVDNKTGESVLQTRRENTGEVWYGLENGYLDNNIAENSNKSSFSM